MTFIFHTAFLKFDDRTEVSAKQNFPCEKREGTHSDWSDHEFIPFAVF